MIINGNKLPYVEVAREFIRNPQAFTFISTDRRTGGRRLKRRLNNSLERTIPIVLTRRKDVDKSWAEIIEDLTGILYRDEDLRISFSEISNRYYLAKVKSLEITEEGEFAARGNITIVGDVDIMFGDDKEIVVTTDERDFLITGQKEVPWKSRTVFNSSSNNYYLKSDYGELLINFNFIPGDILDIDYESRAIKLNNSDIDVGLSLESVWFDLPAGYIGLKSSHDTVISYTERYY